MKILHLTLHRKWFDEIATGRKKEEYRDITPYWTKRLVKVFPGGRREPIAFREIHFRNGYNLNLPFMRVRWAGFEVKAWQAYKIVYAIKLGEILEIKNWSGPACEKKRKA